MARRRYLRSGPCLTPKKSKLNELTIHTPKNTPFSKVNFGDPGFKYTKIQYKSVIAWAISSTFLKNAALKCAEIIRSKCSPYPASSSRVLRTILELAFFRQFEEIAHAITYFYCKLFWHTFWALLCRESQM